MTTPCVTVAMITYQHEAYIEASIRSVLAQTMDDFELLVVDDGSTDETGAIARSIDDGRIRYVRRENGGPAAARNTALEMARGRFVAQISGDDLAEPRRLEEQLAMVDEKERAVIFARVRFIDDEGRPLPADPPGLAKVNRLRLHPDAALRHHLFHGCAYFAPTALAPRRVFEEAGPYVPCLLQSQDYEMWTRMLVNGVDLRSCPEVVLAYRIRMHDRNLSSPTASCVNRLFFEWPIAMAHYERIVDAQRLAAILPELAEELATAEPRDFPILIWKTVLEGKDVNPWSRRHACQRLYALLAGSQRAAELARRLGFTMATLWKHGAEIGPMAETLALRRQIEAIEGSTCWKLVAPLRWLFARAKKRLAGGSPLSGKAPR